MTSRSLARRQRVTRRRGLDVDIDFGPDGSLANVRMLVAVTTRDLVLAPVARLTRLVRVDATRWRPGGANALDAPVEALVRLRVQPGIQTDERTSTSTSMQVDS